MYIQQWVVPISCYLKSRSPKFEMKMVLDQNGSQPSNIKNYYFTWDPPLFDELFLILKDILIAYVSEIFFPFSSRWYTDSTKNFHKNKIYLSLIKIKTHLQFRTQEQWRAIGRGLVCSFSYIQEEKCNVCYIIQICIVKSSPWS